MIELMLQIKPKTNTPSHSKKKDSQSIYLCRTQSSIYPALNKDRGIEL